MPQTNRLVRKNKQDISQFSFWVEKTNMHCHAIMPDWSISKSVEVLGILGHTLNTNFIAKV